MAKRSKARVYGRSLAGIAGSNPDGGINVSFVSDVCCQVQVSATDQSIVQRTVVCHYMWSTNLEHEAGLAHVGLLRQKQPKKQHADVNQTHSKTEPNVRLPTVSTLEHFLRKLRKANFSVVERNYNTSPIITRIKFATHILARSLNDKFHPN